MSPPPPPPPPARGPDKRLLFLLHRANRAVLAHVNGRALEMLGVSASQLSTLLYIAKHPGCSMTDVASVLDVAKSAASGMLRRMEAAGFLRREANPDDARGMRFSLTPRGEEIRGRAMTLVRRLQDELTEGFDEQERATIFRFLNTLVDRYADPLLRKDETMSEIVTSKEDGVLVVTIDRPKKKNALTFDMYRALEAALRTPDPDVRAVLLASTGETFCAGNDVKDFLQVATSGAVRFGDLPQAGFLDALVSSPRPLVAAVHGAAIGVGATMLLHCDLVYASETARLEMPFVSLGLVPEAASSLLLPQRVGHAIAAEMLLLGTPVDARRARELLLVNEIVTAEGLLAHAKAQARALAAKPPEALRVARALIRGEERASIAERMRVEGERFAERLGSDEARQAFLAFVQRKPA